MLNAWEDSFLCISEVEAVGEGASCGSRLAAAKGEAAPWRRWPAGGCQSHLALPAPGAEQDMFS